MATLAVKERILRRLVSLARTVPGVGTVYRWDASGRVKCRPGDVLVIEQEDRASEGSSGSIGCTVKELRVQLAAILVEDENDSYPASARRIHWQAALEAAIMADPFLTETETGERLAVDTRVTTWSAPDIGEGLITAVVEFEIEYQHYRNSPYSGPGISERMEPEGD